MKSNSEGNMENNGFPRNTRQFKYTSAFKLRRNNSEGKI